MAQQIINNGAFVNDPNRDTARTAFQKTKDNFSELYIAVDALQTGKQTADDDLTAIAALTPSNDDFLQRKTGAWTNRTPAQVKTDLALTKTDVGLASADNTSDATKPVSSAQQTALDLKEILSNKAVNFSTLNDTLYPTVQAVKTLVDSLVSGLLDLRGGFDASGNVFPSSGGSGTAGAVMKGDIWFITVGGTLGGSTVAASDCVFANIDAPGQTAGNWTIMETNIGFVPENVANKDIDSTFAANSDTRYPSQKAVKTALTSKGYVIPFGAGGFSPADSATQYIGNAVFLVPGLASSALYRQHALAAGVLTKLNISCTLTTPGSAENVTIKLRNVTTATEVTCTSTQSFAANFATQYTGFSLAVNAGDEIEMQVVCPAWVTNPVSVGIRADAFIGST